MDTSASATSSATTSAFCSDNSAIMASCSEILAFFSDTSIMFSVSEVAEGMRETKRESMICLTTILAVGRTVRWSVTLWATRLAGSSHSGSDTRGSASDSDSSLHSAAIFRALGFSTDSSV